MNEKSPYTGQYDRTGWATLGRIREVDPQSRTVRVNTIDDLDIRVCKVLHGMWHAEGDEEVKLPRINTFGVVLFAGGEAYWLGASPVDMSTGALQRDNMQELSSGDWIVKTIANNRIIVRSGGTIEIQSSDVCRTFWIPSQNLINTVCQNWELETAGGHMKWKLDKKAGTTNLQFKVWNSVVPDNGVTVDVGTIPETNTEEIEGSPAPADLVFDFKQGTLDEKLQFKKRSLRMSVKKDGSIYFDIGPSKFTLTVDAETGDVNFETKGDLTSTIHKDSKIYIGGNQYTEASGGIKQKMAHGQYAVGTSSIELLKKIGDSLEKIATWAGSIGATHTHVGNLGTPTTVPIQAQEYVNLQEDLLTLKLDIDAIRGEF